MKKKDTYSYKGWIISDSFVKRCFASLGYHTVAILMIYAGLLAVGLVIGMMIFFISKVY
jgi:hypothetical protein